MSIDGGFARRAAAMTSHFCTAERQYRMPCPTARSTPTAQWTATAAGCCILSNEGKAPAVTHAAIGRIVDRGITDANNLWAQRWRPRRMTRSARSFPTRGPHPRTTISSSPAISAKLGHEVVTDLFARDGVDMTKNYKDCGLLLYDLERQDMHMGGSGCGCSAAVLNGYLLRGMREGASGIGSSSRRRARCSRRPLPCRARASRACATPSFWKTSGRKADGLSQRLFCGGILCAVGQILIDKNAAHAGPHP